MLKLQNIKLYGVHRVTLASVSEMEAKRLHERIRATDGLLQQEAKERGRRTDIFRAMSQELVTLVREFNAKYGYKRLLLKNVTCDVGRAVIATALAGDIADVDAITVNYGAVGTNAAAPAASNTQLGTELFRKTLPSAIGADASYFGTAFYAAGEGTGTIREHGLFIDGTASANSGDLLSHLALGPIVKGALDTLTVETEIQLNDA